MDAYIIKAYRTAVGKAKKGSFKHTRADELAVKVVEHIMSEVPEIAPEMVDDVIVGCANPEGEQGLQIGRWIAVQALGITVPGMTVNRYCASGLETISLAVAKIQAGMGHVFLAGGMESMSLIPMTGYKFAPSYKIMMETPEYMASMGITSEMVARKYEISREECDAFALRSHQRAAAAIDAGKFKDEIVPIEVIEVFEKDNRRQERRFTMDTDEGVRRDTTLEALARLRPVFAAKGVTTAGNSSQTSDGASMVLVVSEEIVKRYHLKPIARLVSYAVGGVDPLYMGIGPIAAIPKALKRAGLKLKDIEQVELNEAFAAQSLAVIKEMGLDPEIVNVNGGAIALGHPLGCTGAKLSTQLFNEMRRRGQKYGMVTACVGGGQGIAGIYELL